MAINRSALVLDAASVPIAILPQEFLEASKCRPSRMAASAQVRAPKYDIAHVDGHFFAYDIQHFCKAHIATGQKALQGRIASSRGKHLVDETAVIAYQRFSSCGCQPVRSISLTVR